jgi:predicted RNase H-like HicB family nuclease
MAEAMNAYHVDYERDESGHWIATVRKVAGVHTYGRTIEEARRRVREALSTAVEDAATAAFSEHIKLPRSIEQILDRAKRLRREADERQLTASKAARQAAKVLISKLGFSVRDAGALLGVSGQRVQKLAAD